MKTQVYFFKDVDYIDLDNFSASDLVVDEGSKVNGYTALTSQGKVVNQDYLNSQIDTINQIMTDKSYNNWPTVVDDIQNNFSGLGKIKSQIGSDSQKHKTFLINASRYMGLSVDELQQKKDQLTALNDGKTRNIILGELNMQSSGYVYASLNSMEKVINENLLPYIDKSFLDNAGTIDRQNETALKIINNDHLFAAFVMKKDDVLDGQDDALSLKQKYVGTKGSEKNNVYYQYLIKRVDLLWGYPEIAVEKDGKAYNCYLIDIIEDGDYKIPVVIFKDYVNIFASDNITNTNVDIQNFEVYKVPESAITHEGDKTYLTTLEKDYFTNKVEVKVNKEENGKALLKVSDNPQLSVGTSYRVYP